MFRHTKIEVIIAAIIVSAAMIFETLYTINSKHNVDRIQEKNYNPVMAEYDFVEYKVAEGVNQFIIHVNSEKEGPQVLVYPSEVVKFTFTETHNPYVQLIRERDSSVTVSIILPYGYKLGNNKSD